MKKIEESFLSLASRDCSFTFIHDFLATLFFFFQRKSKTMRCIDETTTMNTEIKSKEEVLPKGGNENGGNVPSGFILKLFQMVNGAPDEVITWTPAGDAFIIGSDLQRLESETLPQYFRHNRFQSLVRQLNFYSFRKINRERNVWIYKHKLFHRDRPEDLYMVRRRTCPGVDGRKQRFSRFSAQKLSKTVEQENAVNKKENPATSDDDTASSTSVDEREDVFEAPKKKRELEDSSSDNNPSSKRARRLWTATSKPQPEVVVDTSIISNPTASPTSVCNAHESLVQLSHEEVDNDDDDSSANKKSDRLEMIERSLIISEVASKLEEYARKAYKGRGGTTRTRRGVVGVVTPPWGSSSNFTVSARGLITYDDEYEQEDGKPTVVPDDDMMLSNDASESKIGRKVIPDPPVSETETIKRVGNEIRRRASGNFYNSELIQACACVAEFFMSTAPAEDVDVVSEKILQLLASSGKLAADFHFYRAALHPGSANDSSVLRYRFDQQQVMALRRTLQGGAGRRDALREFKTFCVNLIYKLLGEEGSLDIQEPFSCADRSLLLQTTEIWSQSVGAGA